MNKNYNCPNFKAQLDVSNMVGCKKRWQYIAKVFEERTKSYPNDTLTISGGFTKGFDFSLRNNSDCSEHLARIEKGLSSRLSAVENVYISKILESVLKILKIKQESDKSFNRIVREMKLNNTDEEIYITLKELVDKQKNKSINDILKNNILLDKSLIV